MKQQKDSTNVVPFCEKLQTNSAIKAQRRSKAVAVKHLYTYTNSWSRIIKDAVVHVSKLLSYSLVSSLSVFVPCLLYRLNSDLYIRNKATALAVYGCICFFPVYSISTLFSTYSFSLSHLHDIEGNLVSFGMIWRNNECKKVLMISILISLFTSAMIPLSIEYAFKIDVIKWKIHLLCALATIVICFLYMFYIKLIFYKTTSEGQAKIRDRKRRGKEEIGATRLILKRSHVWFLLLSSVFGYIVFTSYYFFEANTNVVGTINQLVLILISTMMKSIVQYVARRVVIKEKWPTVDIQSLYFSTTILFDTQIRVLLTRIPSSGNIVLLSLCISIAEVVKRCSSSYYYIYMLKTKQPIHKSQISNKVHCINEFEKSQSAEELNRCKKRKPNTSKIAILAIERSSDALAEYMAILASAVPALMIENSPNFRMDTRPLDSIFVFILLVQIGLEMLVDFLSTSIELKQGFPVLLSWDVSISDILLNLSIPGYLNMFIFFLVALQPGHT